MGKYTLTEVKVGLREVTSGVSGIPLHKVKTEQRTYKASLGNTGGMKLIKPHTLYPILNKTVKSNTDMQVISFILEHTDKKGIVKFETTNKHISINDLAGKFEVTRKKVSQIIKRLLDEKLVKKNGRCLVVNPYISVPHNIGKDALYILQTYWDSDFTYDITEELRDANEAYVKEQLQIATIGTNGENL